MGKMGKNTVKRLKCWIGCWASAVVPIPVRLIRGVVSCVDATLAASTPIAIAPFGSAATSTVNGGSLATTSLAMRLRSQELSGHVSRNLKCQWIHSDIDNMSNS